MGRGLLRGATELARLPMLRRKSEALPKSLGHRHSNDCAIVLELTDRKQSVGRKQVSVEHFRRRADECRRLASVARNASDKAFWLGLVERWQALESQKLKQAAQVKPRRALRRQSVLAVPASAE
jgi:hypothetical protein